MAHDLSSAIGVFVGLIGRNPASVVLSARAFDPNVCVLGFTAASKETALAVCEQLGESRVQLFEVATNPPTIEEVRTAAGAVFKTLSATQRTGDVVFDITGGTKTMSIGAALAVYQHFPEARSVWLDERGNLLDANSGQPYEIHVPVSPREVVAWTPGAWVASVKWEGAASEGLGVLAPHVDGIGPLAEVLMRLLATPGAHEQLVKRTGLSMPLTPTAGDGGLLRMRLPAVDLPQALPEGVRREQQTLICERDGPLAQGAWLEFHALAVMRAHFAKVPEARIAFGVHLRRAATSAQNGNLAQDEVDVVVTVGSRTLIVECKARVASRSLCLG
jgi:hypothetical protein